MKNVRLLLAALVLALTAAACGTSTITGPDASRPVQDNVWVGGGS